MSNVEKWNKSASAVNPDKIQSAYAELREPDFPRKSVICDLGGSVGTDTIYFLQNGHSVFLLDISGQALQTAVQNAHKLSLNSQLTTKQVDLDDGKLPLDDKSIEILYSRLALHYFNKQKSIEIFKEIYRVLKDDGQAYIVVKSPNDEKESRFLQQTAVEIEDSVFDDKGQIKSRFNKQQWEAILQAAGIKNFEIKSYTEDLSERGDQTKSGNYRFVLIEILFKK